MSTFNLGIQLAPGTAQALAASGYRLFTFKAVRNSDAAGKVAVWHAGTVAGSQMSLGWDASCLAYVTRSTANPPDSYDTYELEPGQIVTLTDSVGTGSVGADGQPGALSISNATQTPFLAGIAQALQGQQAQPLSLFPLYGNGLQVITPVERVLLVFSTQAWQPGQMIDALGKATPAAALFAGTGGVLVDLSAPDHSSRALAFDINKGWSWDGGVWARTVLATARLAPLLIVPDPDS